MALHCRLETRTRLTGHPGLRSAPWGHIPSFPLSRLSLSPDSVSDSDTPPEIWSLLEDLDSCLCKKELDLNDLVQLVEKTLRISLSSISSSMRPPFGVQRSATDTSNNSLDLPNGCENFIEMRRSLRYTYNSSSGTWIRSLVYIRRRLIPHKSNYLL